jgi:anthranilate synthase
MNTGLTLRTVRIKDGIAEVRAGATLLHDSIPEAEEAETELKASAMLDAIIRGSDDENYGQGLLGTNPDDLIPKNNNNNSNVIKGRNNDMNRPQHRVLLIDHEDSFVHTLANYFRQAGAEVVTCRSGISFQQFLETKIRTGQFKPTLAVLSPGPGTPSQFDLSGTISAMITEKIPIFGVCLGLQGLVEYYGGDLKILDYPMHGKPSHIYRTYSEDNETVKGEHQLSPIANLDVLYGIDKEFTVARYHSLYGNAETMPTELLVTATTENGLVMAIQHKQLPIAAVQFHPESILTLPKNGMQILVNALHNLKSTQYNDVE